MKNSYIAYPPLFFQILFNPHPYCSFCCLVSLAEWVIAPHLCAILLNDIMNLLMSSLGNLVLEGPRCVFYALRRQVYCRICWYFYLISYKHQHTQTQRHIANSGASRLTHPYKYVCNTCSVLTAAIFITLNE